MNVWVSQKNCPAQEETKALAIFLYHLRNFGIVRDIRENDYGIDLEYEFVAGENVVGRVIKIQLKSVSRINKKLKDREALLKKPSWDLFTAQKAFYSVYILSEEKILLKGKLFLWVIVSFILGRGK